MKVITNHIQSKILNFEENEINFISVFNQTQSINFKFKIDVRDIWLKESYKKPRLMLFKI